MEKWTKLTEGHFDYPCWSRDGRYIYFNKGAVFVRVRIRREGGGCGEPQGCPARCRSVGPGVRFRAGRLSPGCALTLLAAMFRADSASAGSAYRPTSPAA